MNHALENLISAVLGAVGGLLVSCILWHFAMAPSIELEARKVGQDRAFADEEKKWHQDLIDRNFAEYDKKTGEWKFRTEDEFAMEAVVQAEEKRRDAEKARAVAEPAIPVLPDNNIGQVIAKPALKKK